MVLGTVLAFFQVGGAEFIVIAIVALVVLGPERLPIALRKVGQAVGQVRSLSDGFRKEVQSAMDEVTEPVRTMTRPQLTALDGGAATTQSAAPQGTTAPSDTSVAQADETPVEGVAGTPTAETAADPTTTVDVGAHVDPSAPPLVSDVLADTAPSSSPTAAGVADQIPAVAEPVVAEKPTPKPRAPRKPKDAAGSEPAARKPAVRKPAPRTTAAGAPDAAAKPRAPRKSRPKVEAPPVEDGVTAQGSLPLGLADENSAVVGRTDDGAEA